MSGLHARRVAWAPVYASVCHKYDDDDDGTHNARIPRIAAKARCNMNNTLHTCTAGGHARQKQIQGLARSRVRCTQMLFEYLPPPTTHR